MRRLCVWIAVVCCFTAGAQTREDPRAISIHPFTGQRGATFLATVRGGGLAGSSAASIGSAPFAVAGQLLTFEVTSGFPQIAATGSAATVPNFDPALTIYEPAGSWFDPKRLKRIAYNDEPVWVFGKPTDPQLVHRFERAGEYLLR